MMDSNNLGSNEERCVNNAMVRALFPEPLPAIADIQKQYPDRILPEGAMVTRIAPSPTGSIHVGTIYTALISERLAHQTNGVFFLRIEDTDRKRELEGASSMIVDSLEQYGIMMDEGPTLSGSEKGAYGPYVQSARAIIYQAYVKHLVESGMAYPCFCSPEEIEAIRTNQEKGKTRTGYYGEWARWRNASETDIFEALKAGRQHTIRLRSNGSVKRKIAFEDILKGRREMSENDQDIVLLKSDSLPTYHLAHVIDDHLMGTTHVLRGDEWFASVGLHLQLFTMFGWKPPAYGHLAPIQKMEGSSKRKLSKRKDPEAGVAFYNQQGYPHDAVVEYLLNLANSNFEEWRKNHPNQQNKYFIVTLDKLANSNGALFDFAKLNDISKQCIAHLADIFDETLAWARSHNSALADLISKNKEYVRQILLIERCGGKIRKDLAKWSDVPKEIEYFFSVHPHEVDAALLGTDRALVQSVVSAFLASYTEGDSKEQWFAKIKEIAVMHGFAESAKAFKAEPGKYKGTIADITKILRVTLTGRAQTPDLYEILLVMGKKRIVERLSPHTLPLS
jgi:glutamyl-tRNA synthetase